VDKKGLIFLCGGILIGGAIGLMIFIRSSNLGQASRYNSTTIGKTVDKSTVIGAQAPDFELSDVDGNRVRLSDFKGKPVLLNFWATWCLPCKIEMPVLDDRYGKNRGRLEVLAINFDEPKEIVQEFASDLGLSLNVLLDPGGVVQGLYGVRGYPTSFLVDRTGIVRIHHIGLLTEGQLDKYLNEVGLEQ
jgi:peroxiredoxin